MQLRKAQALGILDHHQRGARHVDADFDDGGGHQQLQLALFEGVHDGGLFRRLLPAMHEADAQRRQRGLQFGERGFGSLRLQLVRFLDQRAHPVGLAPGQALCTDALDNVGAAFVRQHQGLDGRAPRRQFVDDGGVEIAIGAHGQRARNRCRRHDELVRCDVAVCALLFQRQALVHAEAVLLVDDGQRQARELHIVLEQRMGADDKAGAAVGQRGIRLAPRLHALLAEQRHHADAERCEPAREIGGMLFGEDFRRRHQRHLRTRGQCMAGGQRGDHGLAGADIALYQAQHGRGIGDVTCNLVEYARLRAGQRKRQCL